MGIHINSVTAPPQDDSASVEGSSSDCPADSAPPAHHHAADAEIRPKTGGTPVDTIVTTTFSTEVQRRGDVQTLAALALGQTVHAVGTRMADKTLAARKLQIKDDATDGAFVIEGALGGLKGACPAISFGVNGYTVKTVAAAPPTYRPDVPARSRPASP